MFQIGDWRVLIAYLGLLSDLLCKALLDLFLPLALQRVRFSELRCVDWNIQLHLAKLNGVPPVQPREDETKWHLDSVNVAIIRIIHLRGNAADRRRAVAHQPHQQAGLLVEGQTCDNTAGAVS